MVADLLFLSSNHVQTLRHVQSHLLLLVTKSWLISMYGMINIYVWNDRCGNNVVHVEGR